MELHDVNELRLVIDADRYSSMCVEKYNAINLFVVNSMLSFCASLCAFLGDAKGVEGFWGF